MKCLSVQQPWADLLVRGIKPIENRSWTTNHKGLLGIHASKTYDKDGEDWIKDCKAKGWMDNVKPVHLDLAKSRKGGIVGLVDLQGCYTPVEMKSFYSNDGKGSHPIWIETGLWWAEGQCAWHMKNGVFMPLQPMKGQLGLFNVKLEVTNG